MIPWKGSPLMVVTSTDGMLTADDLILQERRLLSSSASGRPAVG